MNRNIIKTESQPIVVKAGIGSGTTIYFPDNQYIRNKKLMWINVTPNLLQYFPVSEMKYVTGQNLAYYEFVSQCYLTLESYAGVQFLRKKSLAEFIPYLQQGNGNIFAQNNFQGQLVNWPKSYIEIANGIVMPVSDVIVLFDIAFTEINPQVLKTQLGVEFQEKR
jgi:hypothetical protein